MIRGRVYVVEWTIFWIMLRCWSFTIFATVVGAKGFEMTSFVKVGSFTESLVLPHRTPTEYDLNI
jgi:hypothetical protein